MTKRFGVTLAAMLCLEVSGAAHSGPPYPIVTERAIGSYVVSVWTDPDATNDGSRGAAGSSRTAMRAPDTSPVTLPESTASTASTVSQPAANTFSSTT